MQNNNGHNHDGNGHDPDGESGNIIRMPTLAERDRMRREKEKQEKQWRSSYKQDNKPPPAINLPPVTKFSILALAVIHVIFHYAFSPPDQFTIMENFGFIPAYYTGAAPFRWAALPGPFTYVFLHGGWTHLAMNSVMLAAFGAGVERWMGGKKMILFFVLCALAAAMAHLLVNPSSSDPVIGASGGLSGLFAAVLVMLQQSGMGGNSKYGIWPFVFLWVAISAIFGLIGAPGGGAVAWAAHIGGFLAGFIFLKPVMRMKL